MRAALEQAAAGLAEVDFTLEIPFRPPPRRRRPAHHGRQVHHRHPAAQNWGEPLLLGPGSIHVAHTPFEKLAKEELLEAIELYIKVGRQLLA